MNNSMKALFTGLAGAALAAPASAAILGFSPFAADIAPGDSVSVDVYISGLLGPVALGGYQLKVGYDAVRVEATSVTFPAFPASGMDLGNGSLAFWDLSVFGEVAFDETSLELAGDLAAGQPDSFILTQLTFKGLTPGVSPLTFDLVDLADAAGAALGPGLAFSGSINVVPEAKDFALVAGLGLVGFAAWRRRNR